MEMKAENFLPLHVIFNFTVVPVIEDLGGYDATCVVKLHLTNSTAGNDPTKATWLNSSHRSVQSLNSCNLVSLQLEMETGNSTCTMRITWYVLVLLVFIFLTIFIVHKIFQENRRVQTWQSKYWKLNPNFAKIMLKITDFRILVFSHGFNFYLKFSLNSMAKTRYRPASHTIY